MPAPADSFAKLEPAEAADTGITSAGPGFTSDSTGAGTLADDESLAALREKLSSSK